MGAAWPRIQQRLVDLLPTLPGWEQVDVSDGPPVDRESPYLYCAVGSSIDDDFGGSYTQSRRGGDGGWDGAVREEGQIRCEISVSAREDAADITDIAAVRASAFELVDAWDTELVRDPTLSVLGALTSVSLTADVQPMQTDRGAVQRLVVTFRYLTFF